MAASTIDAQFESLEDLSEQTEIEARLAELKAGASPAALGTGTAGAVGTGSSATAGAPAPGTAGGPGQRSETDAEYTSVPWTGGDAAAETDSSAAPASGTGADDHR